MNDNGPSSRVALPTWAVRGLLAVHAIALRPGTFAAGRSGIEGTGSDAEGAKREVEGAVVSISGVVIGASGSGIEGVLVEVTGSAREAAITRLDGRYSAAATNCDARTGSWLVEPRLAGCEFTPPLVRLTRLDEAAVVNFSAEGEHCAGKAAPVDPGPRGGSPGAGGPPVHGLTARAAEKASAVACIRGLSAPAQRLCQQALVRFQEVESVSGTLSGEEGAGLGPAFNGNSCAMCHAQPAVLGSAPAPFSPQRPMPNPQIALATLDGARNALPPFITADGPIRAARFKSDGDVHGLFSIAGRGDAIGCTQSQPNFSAELAADNVSFRIPLALFGLGLVEAVSDATLQANVEASRSDSLGIHGVLNRSASTGTIGRFGWKAKSRSLLFCAAEAYAVEIGVTNELFPEERHAAPGCTLNGSPEDSRDLTRTGSLSDTGTDIENFAFAIRLSAPPEPNRPQGIPAESIEGGRLHFAGIGCSNCHTPTLTTSTSSLDAKLSGVIIHPFSDFALHHMGTRLADGIDQESAEGDQFRTPPLWGVGQRLFFLHDGRTRDLVAAIEEHASEGSEANAVIENFNHLSLQDEQQVVNFLRSL